MKEYLWSWIFGVSLVFCTLLTASLLIAFKLYSTAPQNANTPVFAIGFGFAFGFIGLGASTFLLYDRLVRKLDLIGEDEGELVRKVVREMPFFFFSILYFFILALYMGIFMLMIPFIRTACGSYY
ncbi:MAG: hypothetical protein HQM09_13905 [Candidatus Riflebacteria bacterium]|nr:hypothetical protein [Candidatus Riflebacteria bacterium]